MSYTLGANRSLASFFEMASPSGFTAFRQKASASSREDFLYNHCFFCELQFPEATENSVCLSLKVFREGMVTLGMTCGGVDRRWYKLM